MSYNRLFIAITVLMLIFAACRKEWTATEEDMTNYGWTLFEQASLDLSTNTAKEDFEGDGRPYSKGTLILPREQPYGSFLKDLFEIQRYPDGPAPYDVAGWTLPLLFGIERIEILETLSVAVPGRSKGRANLLFSVFAPPAALEAARRTSRWTAMMRRKRRSKRHLFGLRECLQHFVLRIRL